MRPPSSLTLTLSLICVAALGYAEFIAREIRNPFFEYCTTKAFGWPLPWKIYYCECQKNEIASPLLHLLVNFALLPAIGISTYLLMKLARRVLPPNIQATSEASQL